MRFCKSELFLTIQIQLIYPCVLSEGIFKKDSEEFWESLKEKCNPKVTPHIKLIAFTAYSDMVLGTVNVTTPFEFPYYYGADLLFCSEEETFQFIKMQNDQWIENNFPNIQISDNVTKHLYSITEGHIGFLTRTLNGIFEEFRDLSAINEKLISENLILEYLICYSYISYLSGARGAPRIFGWSDDERQIVEKVIMYGEIDLPFDEPNLNATHLLMKRWVLILDPNKKVHFISKLVELVLIHIFSSI